MHHTRLRRQWQGVVFLDRLDRQMILLRPGLQCLPLAECGLPAERRFTFYDQVCKVVYLHEK